MSHDPQLQSPSISKLRELARRLDSANQHHPSASNSPKTCSYQRILEDRMGSLQTRVARYFQSTEQAVTAVKQGLNDAKSLVDELGQSRRLAQRSYLELHREKEEEVEGIGKVKKLEAMGTNEELQMEMNTKRSEISDKMEEDQRTFERNRAIYQKKAQKMLVGLLAELTNERKQRTRSINELNRRLQGKIEQTAEMIQAQAKVRGETYRKLESMQGDLSERLKDDLDRLTRERRQGSDSLLRMLEEACDTLLY